MKTRGARHRCRWTSAKAAVCATSLLAPLASQAAAQQAIYSTDQAGPVQVVHEGEPPRTVRDQWTFVTEAAVRGVAYTRVSIPPEAAGAAKSLLNRDMGVGLLGGAFENWYKNNTLRVIVDDRDLMAESAAAIDVFDGKLGELRLLWKNSKGGDLTVRFLFFSDHQSVYLVVDASKLKIERSVRLEISGFPGGYTAATNQPAQRFVLTPEGRTTVEPAKVTSPFSLYSDVQLSAAKPWVFLGDATVSTGSLGLAWHGPKLVKGTIALTNYEVLTHLEFGVVREPIVLALSAFSEPNPQAEKLFMTAVEAGAKSMFPPNVLQASRAPSPPRTTAPGK